MKRLLFITEKEVVCECKGWKDQINFLLALIQIPCNRVPWQSISEHLCATAITMRFRVAKECACIAHLSILRHPTWSSSIPDFFKTTGKVVKRVYIEVPDIDIE